MNICEKEEKPALAIPGHLYHLKSPPKIEGKGICILTKSNKMIRLEDGNDTIGFTNINNWIDVTDQYCLQKVD